MSINLLLGDLRRELARGRVIVLVGAGVAVGATGGTPVASWTGLLEDGVARREQLPLGPLPAGWGDRVRGQIQSGDVEELLLAAEAVTGRLGGREHGEYRRWLRETVGQLKASHREVLEALRDLGGILATTNYDGLLEEVTGLPAVTWQDQARAQQVLRGDEQAVLHLHGFWQEPKSVVLGVRSYEQLLGNERAQTIQEIMAAVGTLLFVGFGAGLADPNFAALRAWMSRLFKGGEYRHFRLAKDDEVTALQAEHGLEERVFVLGYGPEHADLAPFLRQLSPTTPPPAPPGTASPPPDTRPRGSGGLVPAEPALQPLRPTGRIAYQDFDLLIEPTGQAKAYRARVLRSPAGESGPVAFGLPFGSLELENFLLKIGRPRRGGTRRIDRPETAALKTFGGELYTAVFQDELRELLLRSLSETGRQRRGLRLRLRLADTPELAGLPWEFLYDQRRNRFLALSKRTPLVRYLELPDPPRPLAVTPPLRVLVMIASPSDFDRLDVDQEWRKLQEALGELQAAGRVAIERLQAATLTELQRRLRQGEWHIFHFIGHGGFDARHEDGVLILEDRSGRGLEVSGEELGGLLNDHDSMCLAVLNACESARGDAADPFAGTAQSLIQQGLPAVVAMQFEITDGAAIIFARELYGAVADGYPLDAALAEARKAIRYDGNLIEWGTPVLYSSAPDGRIFDLPGGSQVNHTRASEAPELSASVVEFGRLPQHSQSPEQRIRLGSAGGGTLNAQAVTSASWLKLRQVGNELVVAVDTATAGEYDGVITVDRDGGSATIRVLARIDPTPLSTTGDAAEAVPAAPERGWPSPQQDEQDEENQQSEQDLGTLWTDGVTAYFQGSWSEAVAALSTLVDRQPNYRSGNAKAKLEDARRQLDLARRYNQACVAQNDGAWPEAISLFEAIVAVDPEYRDVDARLEEVRRTEELATLQANLRSRHQARKWKEVIQLGEQISAAYPEAGDPEGLVASARTELARARRADKSAQLFSAALRHIEAGAWQEAIEVLERLKREDADYRARDVKGLLARTGQELAKAEEDRRQGQLAELYNAGRVAEDAGQWPTAIERFEAALVVDDEYRDAAARLEHARRQRNLDGLRAEAQRLHEARNWEAVLELGVQMRQLDPEGEPDPVVASAQAELAKAERERESRRRYSAAQTAMEAGELQQALKALEELEQMHPGYRDTALLIDATRRELMKVVISGDERVLSLAFTADNRLALATIRRAQIWDLSRRREMHTLDHSRNFPFALAFSFGAEYLAVGASDGIVHVWQLANDWASAALWVGAVVATAVSADGQRLAVANGAGMATVWDVASKHKIASFRHTDTVLTVALSPDGTRLATGSQDKTAHVWDIESERMIAQVRHNGAVRAVALSPDGTRLATGSDSMTQVLGLK